MEFGNIFLLYKMKFFIRKFWKICYFSSFVKENAFLDLNNILSPQKCGFRSNYLTVDQFYKYIGY